MKEQDKTRAKMLGVLLQDARLHAGRTVADCAAILGLPPEQYTQAERGQHIISLPELEVLAIYLKVPMAHFWGSHTLGNQKQPDYHTMLTLRNRIIGSQLRQARIEAGRSPEEIASHLGVDGPTLRGYESGRIAIPLLQLEKVAKYLRVNLDYFLENEHGPLSRHETEQKMQNRFHDLPDSVKSFVVEPVNLPYLQTAMRLSEIDVTRLRGIAEGILDITY